ncbi:Hypothetical predicted protein [Olea europaea subsp. europaea]|uniref:Uncharacterized protein n=1 Tax=Olea europaea subsp. europaea TaxID=158383 RepID=A0A8S0QC13_OLEEU|nr:Hypothetical predicted protein [Olea europaea subsp. europaea]
MAGTCVRALVILLCLFYLVCHNGAIPVMRSGSLGSLRVKKSQGDEITESAQNMVLKTKNPQKIKVLRSIYEQTLDLILQESEEQKLSLEGIKRRIDAELNDYPGSGANNRHTPRPQLGRGCMDC